MPYRGLEFDAKITAWIGAYHHHPWPSIPHTIGIAHYVNNRYVVYRAIEASCMIEKKSLIQFLRSLDMVELKLDGDAKSYDAVFGYRKKLYSKPWFAACSSATQLAAD